MKLVQFVTRRGPVVYINPEKVLGVVGHREETLAVVEMGVEMNYIVVGTPIEVARRLGSVAAPMGDAS